mmetsp:Transcript_26238/g.61449  ORF Transcript_26238/g.61449 Transcript_26238/m.61449 type:complete len:295 (+) Transcript_26238:45-929(+)
MYGGGPVQGYVVPPGGAPGYGMPPGPAPGYGMPPGGYGMPPGPAPGYAMAPGMQSMEQLNYVSSVQIKEQVRIVEALTAALGQEIEMANKYQILDSKTGQEIFFAVEQTDCLTMQLKQCCPDCAAWNVDLLYQQTPAFKLERNWTLTCCCFNRPVLYVKDLQGVPIGEVEDPCTCCNLVFHAKDHQGSDLVTIDGGCCQLGLCCPCPCGPCAEVKFEIQDPSGRQIGEIIKRLSCCKWMIQDDVDNYHIEFGEVGHPAAKLMVMAVAIFMDFKYFSTSSRDDNGGIIGEVLDSD